MTLIFDFPTTQIAQPVNTTAQVFKGLIDHPFISERDFNLNGFRSRLTNIREALAPEGITLHFAVQEFTNEHGRKSSFRKHFLLECEKEKAKQVYNKINVR